MTRSFRSSASRPGLTATVGRESSPGARTSPRNCRAAAAASWPANGTSGLSRPASRRGISRCPSSRLPRRAAASSPRSAGADRARCRYHHHRRSAQARGGGFETAAFSAHLQSREILLPKQSASPDAVRPKRMRAIAIVRDTAMVDGPGAAQGRCAEDARGRSGGAGAGYSG